MNMPATAVERKAPDALCRELSGTTQYRALADVVRAAVDKDARTVDIAWASEVPYQRWYGDEILDCKASSIRLGRLRDGASLLFNHRTDELLGVVEGVQIGIDRVCRAKVRFDTSEEAEKRFQQVLNGVLRQVSVGYMVHRMVLEEESDEKSVYRVNDWEPYELSFVTVAADYSVGVGRSAERAAAPAPSSSTPANPQPATKGNTTMETEVKNATVEVKDQQPAPAAGAPIGTAEADAKRRERLIELGAQYAQYLTLKDVQEYCTNGRSPEALQELVIERMKGEHSDTRGVHLGLSKQELENYSIARAVRAMCTGDWTEAGLERAATEAAAKRFGMASKGLLIPFDVLAQQRDFNVGTAAEAGNLVATQLRPDMFADVLRNKLALGRMGVTYLFGLTGNVDMPRKTVGSSLGFVTEVAALAETQPNTGKVTLTPKRIGSYIQFSKQAVIQSAMAVEPLLRQDVLSEYQVAVEVAAINGSGTGANPRGIRNTSGIGSVVGGTNGAQINWGHIVGLESACANVNSEPDANSGYLVNSRTRGWLKQAVKAANLPFIWDNGDTPLNGYRAGVSNSVPSNLTKGTASGICSSLVFGSNWPMLVVGTFGAVELLLDEVTQAINGMNQLIMNAYFDVGCRRAADFATMDDALTA